jgi:CDP-diacylglycerol--glycerol-3-phosphate 3-phosphatidyltransferase
MFTTKFQVWVRRQAQRFAAFMSSLPVTPNQVTVAGMLATFVAALLLAFGYLLPAGLVLAFAGTFDVIDGALARATRRSYPYGAFLDSITDRYSEGAVYVGLIAYFVAVQGPLLRWQVLGTILALAGSYLVSYARARAQSLGFACEVGIFARPERVVVTVAGLILGAWVGAWVLTWMIWILAVLTNLTAVQRVLEVWRQGREQRRAREAAAVPAATAARSNTTAL